MQATINNLQPRTEGKYKADYVLNDAYKAYLNNNPKNSDFYVDRKTYLSINKKQIEKILNIVLDQGDEYKFPYQMGGLSIVKAKRKLSNMTMDYGNSRKEGVILYHLNEHSSGYTYRFRWRKHNAIIINRSFYSFIPCRDIKRKLAKIIKSGSVEYLQV